MPGNGEIGGGSCKIKFTTHDGNPNTPDSTIETCDHRIGPSTFKVRVTFPNGTVVEDRVGPGQNEKIIINWPVP